MTAPPGVFLSHSHRDKLVARRLARELRPYGLPVWIDEAELRLGAELDATLRAQIEESDVVVVVASVASAESTWVALELQHARAHRKTIVPFYADQVMTTELFRDHLGVDATARTGFGAAAHRLTDGLLAAVGLSRGEPDRAVIKAGLLACAAEEPDVRPFIGGYLDGPGVGYEQTAIYDAPFPALDYALGALLELKRTEPVALSAAYGFRRVGAGMAALQRWVELTGDGGMAVHCAVDSTLAPALIDPAIALLNTCTRPNNMAIYQFIHHNSRRLNAEQRRSTITLVLSPERGPENFGDVLAGVALRHFPDAPEIFGLWRRWIWAGLLDARPSLLAVQLKQAEEEHVPGLEYLYEVLRSHIRSYTRSCDEHKVMLAVGHLRANVDAGTRAVSTICDEAGGSLGSSEWERWEEREPELAQRMYDYVDAHLDEARSSGDWMRAHERCTQAEAARTWARKARKAAADGG
jgi:hypothetical protein